MHYFYFNKILKSCRCLLITMSVVQMASRLKSRDWEQAEVFPFSSQSFGKQRGPLSLPPSPSSFIAEVKCCQNRLRLDGRHSTLLALWGSRFFLWLPGQMIVICDLWAEMNCRPERPDPSLPMGLQNGLLVIADVLSGSPSWQAVISAERGRPYVQQLYCTVEDSSAD